MPKLNALETQQIADALNILGQEELGQEAIAKHAAMILVFSGTDFVATLENQTTFSFEGGVRHYQYHGHARHLLWERFGRKRKTYRYSCFTRTWTKV